MSLQFYDRTEDQIAKGYEKVVFQPGMVLQSAELNEVQGLAEYRQRSLGNAIFKDGDIVRDAQIVVNKSTGRVVCESGAVYLDGAVRGVPPAELTISTVGKVVVGIYLDKSYVTVAEDPTLAEPAVEVQAYGEPGAARLKVEARWGTDGDENFYPIYTIEDGELLMKEAPPVMDAVSQAIARYDVESTASNYVVEGMRVQRLPDQAGKQVYDIQEGKARVTGHAMVLPNSRRVVYDAQPELKRIISEPFYSQTDAEQTVVLARPPALSIIQASITREKTATIVHASVSGATDPLPDTSVVQIVKVWQSGTEYTYGDDYILTGQAVDWSPSGAEPAPGSTYEVTYRFIDVVEPVDFNGRTYRVTGAVPGTLIMSTYDTMLPRIDRLCMNRYGQVVWIQGVSTDYNPVRPPVPNTLIPLAQVFQFWDQRSRIQNDGVRMVSMREIESLGRNMEVIIDLMAQQLLISDINTREAGVKKGVFTDPFLNDTHRDAGLDQDAAVVSGQLMLPIVPQIVLPPLDSDKTQSCAYEIEAIVDQPERTSSMKVNPYMVADIPVGIAIIEPAIDQWTESTEIWSADTSRFVNTSGREITITSRHEERGSTTIENLVSTSQRKLEYLRQIDVAFELRNFGPGEQLETVTFDGIPVTPTGL